MSAAHTPGPWRINAWQIETDGATIGDVYSWADDTPAAQIEAEANARLIVAAPDLLHALQALMDSATNDDGEWYRQARASARAAIDKATGGAA